MKEKILSENKIQKNIGIYAITAYQGIKRGIKSFFQNNVSEKIILTVEELNSSAIDKALGLTKVEKIVYENPKPSFHIKKELLMKNLI